MIKIKFLIILIINIFFTYSIVLPVGETMEYEIRVLGVKAGKQITYIKNMEKISNMTTYHVYSKTSSIGWVRSLYILDDIYEAWLDTNTLLPVKLKRNLTEGKWKYRSVVYLNQNKKLSYTYKNKSKKPRIRKIKENTIDILSMIYYFRNIKPQLNKKYKLFMYDLRKSRNFIPTIKNGGKFKNKWFSKGKKYYKSFLIDDKLITKVKIYILPNFNYIPVKVVIPVLKIANWGTIDVKGTLKKYYIQ